MGFGRVLGGVWSLSGVSWATFGPIFGCLYFECSPKGALEAPGVDFGVIWRGLGGVFGGFFGDFGCFLEDFGEGLEGQKL